MAKVVVVNRETGDRTMWDMANVKSYCDPQSIGKMRERENHQSYYFMIEFRGLEYGMAMYEVDKYDLVVE